MMKRMLMTSLSLVLALGLAACGNGNSGGNAAEGTGDAGKLVRGKLKSAIGQATAMMQIL